MKKFYPTLTAALCALFLLPPFGGTEGGCQSYQWANGIGGSIDDYGRSIAVDTAT
ncbi:MAG: hypothetical protein HYY40_02260, partial [Bacteroidetes bacterium]|nr:hypothetical protein [Bacteroidota bacterium]